jgi:hypothetical protein
MCSNCSGEDPQPESFALFDVSSPKSDERFADSVQRKRKRYRTAALFTQRVQTALTLAIRRARRSSLRTGIIGSVDRGSFVNLNLGSSTGENAAKSRNTQDAAKLIEIRVSDDAIIEVFAGFGSDESTRNAYGLHEQKYLSAWEESHAERNKFQHSLSGFRMRRRLKCFMAYGAFATVVALAVWCAIR